MQNIKETIASALGGRKEPSKIPCKSNADNNGNSSPEMQQGTGKSSMSDQKQPKAPDTPHQHDPQHSNAPAAPNESAPDLPDEQDEALSAEEDKPNKYQEEAQQNEDKLKAIKCWDDDGKLPRNHTSRYVSWSQ